MGLFGAISYWDGSCVVPISAAAQPVVAFVAMQPTPVGRAVVAGRLWPDVSDSRARANLRSLLWRSKRTLGDLLVDLDGRLAIHHDVAVDFRDESDWSKRMIHGTATESDLRRDVSPHVLELLAGMYDEWIVVERDRFVQRWMHAAELTAIELAKRGRAAEALDCALAVISADPLRESAQRVAVECHVIEHNIVEARRRQRDYAKLLRSELGLEPSPDFMALA